MIALKSNSIGAISRSYWNLRLIVRSTANLKHLDMSRCFRFAVDSSANLRQAAMQVRNVYGIHILNIISKPFMDKINFVNTRSIV